MQLDYVFEDFDFEKVDIIYKAFETCGFDREYLNNNFSEFSMFFDPIHVIDEMYYHKDVHLFTCKKYIDNADGSKSQWKIEFSKKGLTNEYKNMKKEMDVIGEREGKCASCIHLQVCGMKQRYLNVVNTLQKSYSDILDPVDKVNITFVDPECRFFNTGGVNIR